MRHLTAVRIGSGWRYASLSRRGGYPLGDCADHLHDTEAEARECYSAFLRAHVKLDGKCSWNRCSVRGCGNPANQTARVEGDGYRLAVLCPEHLTLEHAYEALHLNGPAGDAWES